MLILSIYSTKAWSPTDTCEDRRKNSSLLSPQERHIKLKSLLPQTRQDEKILHLNKQFPGVELFKNSQAFMDEAIATFVIGDLGDLDQKSDRSI